MRVRRTAAVSGLALGLVLATGPAWADEPTPDPACTTYPADPGDGEVTPEPGDGEVTAEPGPVEETPVEEPQPSEEPAPSEEPSPDPEPTLDPSAEPTEEPSPEPSEFIVCMYAAEGTPEVQDSGGGAGAAAEQLPRTGTHSVDLVGLGSGLVLLGAGAVVVGRRRRA
jgi:LPXTG-motif cell wall-anchored protein